MMAGFMEAGLYTFVTPEADPSPGVGIHYKKFVDPVVDETADLIFKIIDPFVQFMDDPYGTRYSGIDWPYHRIRDVVEVYFTEEVIDMPDLITSNYKTLWAAMKGYFVEGAEFGELLWHEYLGVQPVIGLTAVAEKLGHGEQAKLVKNLVSFYTLAVYEALGWDQWVVDGGDSYFLPTGFDVPGRPKPVVIQGGSIRGPGRLRLPSSDARDFTILKMEVWKRASLIAWELLDRQLLSEFIIDKMDVVDTSQDSPLAASG